MIEPQTQLALSLGFEETCSIYTTFCLSERVVGVRRWRAMGVGCFASLAHRGAMCARAYCVLT